MTALDYLRLFTLVFSVVVMGFSIYVMRSTEKKYDEVWKLISKNREETKR